MPFQRADSLCRRSVPQINLTIGAAADENVAATAESDGTHASLVPGAFAAAMTRYQVPQADLAVGAAGHNRLAVRADRHCEHLVRMRPDLAQRVAVAAPAA